MKKVFLLTLTLLLAAALLAGCAAPVEPSVSQPETEPALTEPETEAPSTEAPVEEDTGCTPLLELPGMAVSYLEEVCTDLEYTSDTFLKALYEGVPMLFELETEPDGMVVVRSLHVTEPSALSLDGVHTLDKPLGDLWEQVEGTETPWEPLVGTQTGWCAQAVYCSPRGRFYRLELYTDTDTMDAPIMSVSLIRQEESVG